MRRVEVRRGDSEREGVGDVMGVVGVGGGKEAVPGVSKTRWK